MRKSPSDMRPERRALRIYAFDPMLARAGDNRVTLDIPYRPITHHERSFQDDRLEVIDYDAAAGCYYKAIDLDDARIAMQDGVEPSDSDPQFHQQMVYGVASGILEHVDRALGHRFRFKGGRRLRLLPHAFQGRNAYYDQKLNAVLFGYFPADEDDPGANLPGQAIFTCLSHDIVAHEVTHAVLDRLHQYYRVPTNPHVPAFHEGFADIVALLHRFTFADVVRSVIRETRGDLLGHANPFLDIGAQFGRAAGLGTALRSVGVVTKPAAFANTTESHALGRILGEAVYEGFVRTYERRTADLVRIATGGSGRLPDGELHPDLVNRLADECAQTADAVLCMVLRATDYLPPVDPTFSDFLRAMVTADFEWRGTDRDRLRAAMIESFRIRGIHPESVGSLAVDSLLLERGEDKPDPDLAALVGRFLTIEALETNGALVQARRPKVAKVESPNDWAAQQQDDLAVPAANRPDADEPDKLRRDLARDIWRWADEHRRALGLEPRTSFALRGFHPVSRIAPNGEPRFEMVAQFVQTRALPDDLGGLEYLAGSTLIASGDGASAYVIKKPFDKRRQTRLLDWVARLDAAANASWPTRKLRPKRITEAFSARAIESRRWR